MAREATAATWQDIFHNLNGHKLRLFQTAGLDMDVTCILSKTDFLLYDVLSSDNKVWFRFSNGTLKFSASMTADFLNSEDTKVIIEPFGCSVSSAGFTMVLARGNDEDTPCGEGHEA